VWNFNKREREYNIKMEWKYKITKTTFEKEKIFILTFF